MGVAVRVVVLENTRVAATVLADQLGVPVQETIDNDFFCVVYAEEGVSLHAPRSFRLSPLKVDFASGKSKHRFLQGDGFGQPLAKAIGAKASHLPYVLDATAGLGGDAFVIASLGCKVQMVERNVILAALLADGLTRASEDIQVNGLSEIIQNHLQLQVADMTSLDSSLLDEIPEVVYLDPMYHKNSKRRLPGRTMQYFRALLTEPQDDVVLFEAALALKPKRIVVKRSVKDATITTLLPSHQIFGKTTRYDVYLTACIEPI